MRQCGGLDAKCSDWPGLLSWIADLLLSAADHSTVNVATALVTAPTTFVTTQAKWPAS